MTNEKHIGSTFDSLLKEEGILDECELKAKLALIQDFVYEKCGSPVKEWCIYCDSFKHNGCEEEDFMCQYDVQPIEIGLAHVLNSARDLDGRDFKFQHGYLVETIKNNDCFDSYSDNDICGWDLLNIDKTQALFKDQSPETQLAIAKLLGWEE